MKIDQTLTEWEAIAGTAPDETEIPAPQQSLKNFKAARSTITSQLIAYQHAERQAKQANEQTNKA